MKSKITHLENVLEQLRSIALTNPANLPIYIAEVNALLQISDHNFSAEDIKWFQVETEKIIDCYLGGVLYPDEQYASCGIQTQ